MEYSNQRHEFSTRWARTYRQIKTQLYTWGIITINVRTSPSSPWLTKTSSLPPWPLSTKTCIRYLYHHHIHKHLHIVRSGLPSMYQRNMILNIHHQCPPCPLFQVSEWLLERVEARSGFQINTAEWFNGVFLRIKLTHDFKNKIRLWTYGQILA